MSYRRASVKSPCVPCGFPVSKRSGKRGFGGRRRDAEIQGTGKKSRSSKKHASGDSHDLSSKGGVPGEASEEARKEDDEDLRLYFLLKPISPSSRTPNPADNKSGDGVVATNASPPSDKSSATMDSTSTASTTRWES